MKKHLPFLLFFCCLSPAQSQELIVGGGFADYSASHSKDTGIFSAEYHFSPQLNKGNTRIGFGGSVSIFGTEDIHLGFGPVAVFDLNKNWFIEASVMPGLYFNNEERNDLGSSFEIRSLLSVGKQLKNGHAVSLALTHKSNASTAPQNPGVNAVLLRWHLPVKL